MKAKGKGLNLKLSDGEDDFDKFMPPSKAAFEKRFGDTILGDYNEDDASDKDNENADEPPKPTADVMMSRNLKGGAAKNFNFAFSSEGENESQDSPKKATAAASDSDEDHKTSGFGSKPINLLSKGGAPPSLGKTGKGGLKLPSLIMDDDDLKDAKNDLMMEDTGFTLNLPADRKKPPTSFINSEEADDIPGVSSETAKSTTEAALTTLLDTPSGCSSEFSSAKKTQKSHFTNRKQPNIKLAIDIVSINN